MAGLDRDTKPLCMLLISYTVYSVFSLFECYDQPTS